MPQLCQCLSLTALQTCQQDSATDRSSVAVGLSIIHKNARAPTPPFPYKYLDAWSKVSPSEAR